jgi:isoaspartyl peptidase/L-asparaginase-like protein (Ntn-hydrolase superfamily)
MPCLWDASGVFSLGMAQVSAQRIGDLPVGSEGFLATKKTVNKSSNGTCNYAKTNWQITITILSGSNG